MQVEYVKANSSICQERVSMGIYDNQQDELKNRHKKILSLLRSNNIDNELIKILDRFFTLDDEITDDEGPKLRMMEYMETLTSELLELLFQKNVRDLKMKLYHLFIRFNFNKESVYKYYRNKIENQVCSTQGKENEILTRWSIESKTAVRNDMAYNTYSNTLSSDIITEIKRQKLLFTQNHGIYRPINFGVPAVIYVTIISILMKIGLIENKGSLKSLYKTIKSITRGPENKGYEFITIRNYFQLDDINSLRKAEEVFMSAIDYIRQREEELTK